MEDRTSQSPGQATGSAGAGGERVVYVVPSEAMSVATADHYELLALWNIAWRERWLVTAIVALFTALGLAYALLAAEWFRAEVLMVPAEEKSVPILAGQLSGLASLAGVSVGGGSTAEPVAVLKSREFARDFIDDLDLIPVILHNHWDADAGRWKARDQSRWPDIRDAVRYFERKVRTVNVDRRSGLVTLSIEWIDPDVAANWANLLVSRLNDRMRARALIEAERNVRYLREELAATNVVSLQQSIGRLLEAELQKLMLARGNEEFAFRVVDRAEPPKLRSKPRRKLTVILAFLLGNLVAVSTVIIRNSLGARSRSVDA